MNKVTTKEKDNFQTYMKEFWPPMIIYCIGVFAIPTFSSWLGEGIWTTPLLLLQAVPLYFVARSIVRFIRRSDELFRKIALEATTVTVLIISLFSISYGFLEFAGYPHIPLFFIGVSAIPVFFISSAIIRRSY